MNTTKNDIKSLEKTLDIFNQPKGFLVNPSNATYPVSDRVTCIGIKKWVADGCPQFWQ
ncbi:MAG: hypothetical protein HQK84_03185 [Nitrospinae bacterium]|nr:hypothetical protein [Nitrospinota bacterium]